VNVIGHQHVAVNIHVMPSGRVANGGQIELIVQCAVKDVGSVVATLDDVLCQAGDLPAR